MVSNLAAYYSVFRERTHYPVCKPYEADVGPKLRTIVVGLVVHHVAGLGHDVPHVAPSAAAGPQFVPRALQVQLLGALEVRSTLVPEHPTCTRKPL